MYFNTKNGLSLAQFDTGNVSNTVEDLYSANLETRSFALYRILHYIEHFLNYKT